MNFHFNVQNSTVKSSCPLDVFGWNFNPMDDITHIDLGFIFTS